MSRMTKFLRQTCTVEAYELDETGAPKRNEFGELVYKKPVTRRCRRELMGVNNSDPNGRLVQQESRYYLDDSMEILADYLIDGQPVHTVAEYINGIGRMVGYEVYVNGRRFRN